MKKIPPLKGTIYIGISRIVFVLSGYITNFWLARYLGPDKYGIYGVIISFITALRLISTEGFSQAISKFCAEDGTLAYSIKISMLKILIPFAFLIAITCYFSAPFLAVILKDDELIPFIRISVPIIPLFTIYAIFVGYFNGLHLFNKQSYLLTIYPSIKLIFIILLSIYFGLYGSIMGFIVALAVTIFAGVLLSEKGKLSYFNSSKLIKFAIPIIINSIIFSILMDLGLLMIKSILTDNILTGYYNASVTLSKIPIFLLSGAVSMILLPITSNTITSRGVRRIKDIVNRWVKFSLIIILPITFLFSFTSSKLIDLLYSKKYILASKSFSILIYGMIFLAIFNIMASILNGIGKPYIPMIIALVSLILNFLLNIYLIPNYQLSGAAISTLIVGLFAVTLISYLIHKEFKVLISIKSLLNIVLASLITSVPLIFITLPKYLLLIEYMLSISIYFIILYVLKEITKEDIEKVKKTMISFLPQI